MESLEIGLSQGVTKGLKLKFLNLEDSESLDLSQYYYLKQVHGNKIHDVATAEKSSSGVISDADGLLVDFDLIKSSKKFPLIKTADCAPLFYIDRESEKVALVHAGWRGLQQGIHKKLFEKEILNPATTWVWLGPSLNAPCFEVGEDVWQGFNCKNDEEIFAKISSDASKRQFNSWKFLEKEFESLSVELFYNVEVNTFSSKHFASYRRAKKTDSLPLNCHNYSVIEFLK